MQDIPRRLKLLDKKLAALPLEDDGMLLSELDGFLAGILVCPDLIMPGEWLPLVWGGEGEEAAPVFEDARQLDKLVRLIMEHYNATSSDLRSGRFAPLFDIDTRHDETLWELWITGFETAMRLRPETWALFLEGDEDTRLAMAGLVALAEIGSGESSLKQSEIDDLTEKAPDLILVWVQVLHDWRIGRHVADAPTALKPRFGKVGRNEPCPCGSGKKYKRCCGLN